VLRIFAPKRAEVTLKEGKLMNSFIIYPSPHRRLLRMTS
jgi:hypothetical protein